MSSNTGVKLINHLISLNWPQDELQRLALDEKSLWLGKAFGLANNQKCSLREAIGGIAHIAFSHTGKKTDIWQNNAKDMLDILWKCYSPKLSANQIMRMQQIIDKIKETISAAPEMPFSKASEEPNCLTKCALTFSINHNSKHGENIVITEPVTTIVQPGILAATSPYFQQLLYGDLSTMTLRQCPDQNESEFEVSILEGGTFETPIKPIVFNAFMKWLTTGKGPKNILYLKDFFYLCDQYQVEFEPLIPRLEEFFDVCKAWGSTGVAHMNMPHLPLVYLKVLLETANSKEVLLTNYVDYQSYAERAVTKLIFCMMEEPEMLYSHKAEIEEILALANEHTHLLDLSDLGEPEYIKERLSKEILEFVMYRLNKLYWLDSATYQHFLSQPPFEKKEGLENHLSGICHPSLAFHYGFVITAPKSISLLAEGLKLLNFSQKQKTAAFSMLLSGVPIKLVRHYAEKNQKMSQVDGEWKAVDLA